jgi:THO complex subunit 5
VSGIMDDEAYFSQEDRPKQPISSVLKDPYLVKVYNTVQEIRKTGLQDTASNAPENALNPSQVQKSIDRKIIRLKTQNRHALLDVRSTKEETAAARNEIDTLRLQLQNLYYKQKHLTGEIEGVKEYE